ncbi:hypothetical protein [Deinococcus pimensis]|uniref:hypothetical protein n=1 Tax=Deinococcus pimensis TaxID=309888 RepID=UPI000484EA21|nr:hypothetical protein [Deinococcus pimensis]
MTAPRAVLLAALGAALTACGTITLKTVDLPDSTLYLPPASADANRIVYLTRDQFEGFTARLPSAVTVNVTGDAKYTTTLGLGNFQRADVYVRTDLAALRSDTARCQDRGDYIECSGRVADEANFRAGTLAVGAGGVQLGGAALQTSIRENHSYFGLVLTQGSTSLSDRLDLTNLKARVGL